jgi:hypothetical protein
MTTALDFACQLDDEFFKSNPQKSEYRRNVVSGEVPRPLRKQGIREVLVVHLAQGFFLRGFMNEHGHVVAQSVYFDYRFFSSDDGMRQVQSVLQAISETFPLASPDRGGVP